VSRWWRIAGLFGLLLSLYGQGCARNSADPRTLHYIGDDLVSSRPVSPGGYEAYLRARLALERDPPALDEAAAYIDLALRLDPYEPHLWTTRAEIAQRAGDLDGALASVRRALELRPEYAPAQTLLVRLEGGKVAATTAAGRP
jgi:tetratricopeptide (TPR) repeat protein